MSVSVSLALPPFRAGQIRIFGIGSEARVAAAPDIPTVAEAGLPGYAATAWFGLFAPAGTPREIVLKLNGEVRRILADPEFDARFLAPQMFEPMPLSPDEFNEFVRAEAGKWAKVIREKNLKIE
jgi:tripartite-type tricarboxylate transporter receptor subunit TctC